MKKKQPDRNAEHTLHILDRYAGAVISARRKKLGLSGRQLGLMAGVSQQQISRYEKGRSNITLSQLGRLSEALGMSLHQFMDELFLFIETSGTDVIDTDNDSILPYLNYPKDTLIDTITAEVLDSHLLFKHG
ncbi:TPA: helix-turn-helix domain-containing protein [Morganella morganii]